MRGDRPTGHILRAQSSFVRRAVGLPPRYRVIEPLGSGGMSEVYLVEDEVLGRRVAVKLLSEAFTEDEAFKERFLREARTAARLGPRRRVVTVYDVGEWSGRPYIVMELVEGGTLADRLADGIPDRSTALRWLAQAGEALDAAHAEGIVHRDVKPANLLLDGYDDVRIADFGLACPELAGSGLTPPGGLVGTAGYLAPEIELGGRPTAASDLYALAVVACELLGGDRPSGGRAPVSIPAPAARAIERNLSADPSARYGSASAFVDALTEALEGTQDTRVLGPGPAAVPTRFLGLRGRRRTRTWVAVVTGCLVVGIAGGATATAIATGSLGGSPETTAKPKPKPAVLRCTVSPTGHDANLVVVGVRAHAFCADEADLLTSQGTGAWVFRKGKKLRAPDYGRPEELTVVCSLRFDRFDLTVYDDGAQEIGTALCQRYAAG